MMSLKFLKIGGGTLVLCSRNSDLINYLEQNNTHYLPVYVFKIQ